MGATLLLAASLPWAFMIVWVFNVWGAVDLLNAMYRGVTKLPGPNGPNALGAAFYVPTVIVPALLISHALIFWLLLANRAL
jgi:hypothetical protein